MIVARGTRREPCEAVKSEAKLCGSPPRDSCMYNQTKTSHFSQIKSLLRLVKFKKRKKI